MGCRAQHSVGRPAPLADRRPRKSWGQISSLCGGRKSRPYPAACFLRRWGVEFRKLLGRQRRGGRGVAGVGD